MEIWIIASYIVGTITGYYITVNSVYMLAVTSTIDTLIENRYIRHREDKDGNIEFLEYDEKDDESSSSFKHDSDR